MSFATWNFLKVYARIRETFLRAHPEKRLFPEPPEDSETPDSGIPFITLGEKGKKIGVVVVALVILLLASNRE